MDAWRVKEELERGMDAANQLSLVLAESRRREAYSKEALRVSRDNHSASIIKSFDTALSMVKNAQFNGFSLATSTYSNGVPRQPLRPTTVTTELKEDGYTWRKYGQKTIVNSRHPREYYRCGLKDQGCQATKKVQVISSNPTRYKIVYYGQHSCQNYQILGDEFGQDSSNMLSFGCPSNPNPNPKPKPKPKPSRQDAHSSNFPSTSAPLMIQEENIPSNSQDIYMASSPDDPMTMNQFPETPFPVDLEMDSSMWYTDHITNPHFVVQDYRYLVDEYDEQPDNGFSEIRLWD